MVASLTLTVTALLMRRDVDHERHRRLLYVTAVLLSLGDAGSAFPPLAGVASPLTLWAVPPLGLAMLTYPGQRVSSPWHGWLLVAVTVEFAGVWTAAAAVAYVAPGGALEAVLDALRFWGGWPLPLLACVALAQRFRRASPPERMAMRSITVVGLVVCGSFALRLAALGAVASGPVGLALYDVARVANLVCLGLAPTGLLLESVRRRSAQRHVLESLLRARSELPVIEEVMGHALRDPSLRVRFSTPEPAELVEPVDAAQSAGRLLRTLRTAEGEALATVDTDARSAADPAQLRVVLAGGELALDNVRMQVALRAQLDEVRRSRTRIVEAGIEARRRLERDLHDGAQQRLLAVAATLSRARTVEGHTDRGAVIEEARTQLAEARTELRRLARGIHPEALTEGGLSRALPTLADAAGVRLDLDVPAALRGRRFAAGVESTLWFVASEAVTNAVRHSAGGDLRVSLSEQDGEVRLDVVDNGRGGAVAAPGGGLKGLEDRVAALGGALSVRSSPGHGTLVTAVLPCGS